MFSPFMDTNFGTCATVLYFFLSFYDPIFYAGLEISLKSQEVFGLVPQNRPRLEETLVGTALGALTSTFITVYFVLLVTENPQKDDFFHTRDSAFTLAIYLHINGGCPNKLILTFTYGHVLYP